MQMDKQLQRFGTLVNAVPAVSLFNSGGLSCIFLSMGTFLQITFAKPKLNWNGMFLQHHRNYLMFQEAIDLLSYSANGFIDC